MMSSPRVFLWVSGTSNGSATHGDDFEHFLESQLTCACLNKVIDVQFDLALTKKHKEHAIVHAVSLGRSSGHSTPGGVSVTQLNGKINTTEVVSRLQDKQELFEDAVWRHPTCDVKIQELLRCIRSDRMIWQSIENNIEIRVIRAKHEDEIGRAHV